MEAEEFQESAKSFVKCYELAPEEGSLEAANLGYLYLNSGDLAEAERWYRIAVKRCPERIDYIEGDDGSHSVDSPSHARHAQEKSWQNFPEGYTRGQCKPT